MIVGGTKRVMEETDPDKIEEPNEVPLAAVLSGHTFSLFQTSMGHRRLELD